MAVHACVYHRIYISSIQAFLFPVFNRQGVYSSPPPCFFFHCLRRSPSVSLFNIWVPVSLLSLCFGSFACPKIDLAALWHTDPGSSLNGPAWFSRGLWKECLISEAGEEWGTWRAVECIPIYNIHISDWSFKLKYTTPSISRFIQPEVTNLSEAEHYFVGTNSYEGPTVT